MNLQIEVIVNALNYSYQGDPDQIVQAQQFLLNMINLPNEYSSTLINIMVSDTFLEMTRVAAAIQFKYLLSNSDLFNGFTIDNLIEIINKTPPLVQVQLQTILARIVDKYLSQDPEQGIQILLTIITTCLNSDINHIFVGIQIIRFIFKSNSCKIYPGIGDKEILASKYIIPVFNILSNLGISTPNPFLLHYLLLTANYLLIYSDLQPLENWINVINLILNQETEFLNIDKDAVKFATGIIELKGRLLDPRMASSMFFSIANRIKRNQMTYKGILYSLRYIYQFLQSHSFVACMLSENNQNFLFEFVTETLFNFFVLNQNAIQQIDEDLFNFLLFRHNANNSQMFETPISGSIHVLKKICEEKYYLNEISEFSLFELTRSINEGNYCTLYGASHFASIIASYTEPSFTEAVIQTFTSTIQKNQEDRQSSLIKMTSFFLFLSNIKINNLDLFIFSLNCLTNESLPDIIHYFCAISIPSFFIFFKIEEIAEKIQSNFNLPVFIQKIVELNSKYPTIQISASIKMIFQYFLIFLEPVSIEVVQELFSIYHQFVNEENENKSKICSSIIRLSNMMNSKAKSIDFYSISLQITLKLLNEVDSSDYEDLLVIMNNIIINSSSTNINLNLNFNLYSLNDFLIQIPEFLFLLIENSFEPTIFQLITDILKALSIYFIQVFPNNSISQSISKILQNFLEKFINCKRNEELDDLPLLIPSINKLSQILFIVLKNQEILPHFLEIFTTFNDSSFADSFAAMATISPIATFSNENNFRICLFFASPAAFLLCFQFVMQNLNQMPSYIVNEQIEIQKMISKHLVDLLQEIDQSMKKNNIEALSDDDDSDIIIFYDDDDEVGDLNDIDNNVFNVSGNLEDQDIFDFQSLIAFYQ